jgi:hypothetical protein
MTANVKDTVILDELCLVRSVRLTIECGTLIEPPSAEHPDGVVCGTLISTDESVIPAEDLGPERVAEVMVPCPRCSQLISKREGRPITALIPVAVLAGEQVQALEEDPDGVDDEPDESGEEPVEDEEADETLRAIEITPEDQAGMDPPAPPPAKEEATT